MRYITLNEHIIKELQEIVKTDIRHKSRIRAQALLLSNQGKKIPELVKILGSSQRTIYRWFDRFNQDNINTLHELAGRGRKPHLNRKEHENSVKMHIKKV